MRLMPVLVQMLAFLVLTRCAHAAVTITNPPPTGTTIVAAGDDFATQVIGNAWDMGSATDFDIGESGGFNTQSISGTYSATIAITSGAGAGGSFYPLPPGWGKATLPHWTGELFPVDTAHYHNFSIKVRDTGGTGKQPVGVVFFRDGDSAADGSFGHSSFKYIPQQGQWTIINWDLQTETYGSPYHSWSEYAQVHGLRFDFANDPSPAAGTLGPNVQVAWIRVTTPNPFSVTWTDSPVGSYYVTAIDSGGTRFAFNSPQPDQPPIAVSGTSYSADLAMLPPGDYRIEIKNAGTGATSTSGVLHINAPPQLQILSPSVRGEQTQSFALVNNGHQWGPLAAGDFSQLVNFASNDFTTPIGSFHGRAANGDPQLWLTLSAPINTALYRSVCVTFKVFGPRDVGAGSVARFFWGVASGSMSGTEGFVLYNNANLNEYCFKDMSQLPLDPLSPPAPWNSAGTQNFLRFDPHEFAVDNTDPVHPSQCQVSPSPSNCHDVRFDSFTLSPFAQANPGYMFKWTLSDSDNTSAAIDLYLDPDKVPFNGNEFLIDSQTASTGNGQFQYMGSGQVPSGTYNTLIVADDGHNAVMQYAGGPIVVSTLDEIFRDGFEDLP